MTNSAPEAAVYAADWVLPVTGPALRDGAVLVADGRIAWIGHRADLPHGAPEPLRCGDVMTPGLVNAHTHLQYTGFHELGRRRFDGFEDWSRAFGELYEAYDQDAWCSDAREGARLGVASGTTVFAEIVTDRQAQGAVTSAGATGIEYFEAIGQTDRTWRDGGREDYLRWLDDAPADLLRGISPHAAYSLDAAVIAELRGAAERRGMRLHAHLGESALEAEFYLSGTGNVLSEYSRLRHEFALVLSGGSGLSTGCYADSVGLLGPTCHVAHGVYLDRADRDLLLHRHTQVALCPRSNAVIGLDEAPVADYLREGHEIAVGTDSLASSPSLDLVADVAELARIADRQGYADDDLCERLIRAATLGGALALGFAEDGYGQLRVDGPADLACFDVVVEEGEDAHHAIVTRGAGGCTLTVSRGHVLHARLPR